MSVVATITPGPLSYGIMDDGHPGVASHAPSKQEFVLNSNE